MQQHPELLLEGKGHHPSSVRIWSIFLDTIEGHQSVALVGVYQLAMIHHIVDHHLSEIPIWKIGIVLIYGIVHSHAFLDGMKQTVACPINLKYQNTALLGDHPSDH